MWAMKKKKERLLFLESSLNVLNFVCESVGRLAIRHLSTLESHLNLEHEYSLSRARMHPK
jgi:hypothetical protein